MEDKERQELFQDIEELFSLDDKIEIGSQYDVDKNSDYHTKLKDQQKKRATIVTDILENYKTQQKERYEYKKKKKPCIVTFLLILIGILTASVCVLSFIGFNKEVNTNIVIALVSTYVTYLSAILSILVIVVRYIFPDDEDKNFNELVSSIIENDTERIKNENDYDINKKG